MEPLSLGNGRGSMPERRHSPQRLRSFTRIVAPASDADSGDDDDHCGMAGPTPNSYFTSAPSSSSTRKPTQFARTRLNPRKGPFIDPFSLFTPSNALLRSSSSLQGPPHKFIFPLLVDMQEQSPPPYTPQEVSLNDSSYHTPQRERPPTPSSSSSTNIPSHAPSPLAYPSSASSHPQSHVRRRNITSSGSHPASRLPSPTISDSGAEDGPLVVRHRSSKRGLKSDEDEEDLRTSSGTSKRLTNNKCNWSWRHWLFALAAGVVGLGDGRDDEREQKMICTTPGSICAGETETETDEPSRHLPTARIISPSESSPCPGALQHLLQKLIPLLFEFSRLLSIVPAFFGTIWNLYCFIWPPSGLDVCESGSWGSRRNERVDFFVAALWSILTGYQCLALTTGLLTRWQTYYPPLATLIRLLALQGICWPATQLTLTVLDHVKRPVVCWCVIGTTTCFSRSVQIWVTSNISVEEGMNPSSGASHLANTPPGPDTSTPSAYTSTSIFDFLSGIRPLVHRKSRFRWASTERRWDWKEVSLKCVLPAGVLYFIMAWVGELRREWAGC